MIIYRVAKFDPMLHGEYEWVRYYQSEASALAAIRADGYDGALVNKTTVGNGDWSCPDDDDVDRDYEYVAHPIVVLP